jgi:hypothetical protein
MCVVITLPIIVGDHQRREKISQACTEQSLICFDDQALSQSMNFPPRLETKGNGDA